MRRRTFLGSTGAVAAGLAGVRTQAATDPGDEQGPPGVAWRRRYDDLDVDAVVPAHGGGHVLLDRQRSGTDSDLLLRIARIDDAGGVRRTREIVPDVPDDARRASADVVRTDAGYAVATGTWFATLDATLSVGTTGFAPGFVSNHQTQLVEVPDGFVVARDVNYPERLYTRVLKFGPDGDQRWSRRYGHDGRLGLATLSFLETDPRGGVVVGGSSGPPWLASLAADGRLRWKTTLDGAHGFGSAATVDGDGITLLGEGGLLRLTPDGSTRWRRTYDGLGDFPGGRLVRTADGGYVLAKMIDGIRFVAAKIDATGRLQWRHVYSAGPNTGARYGVSAVVEDAPGEYLVGGTVEEGDESWGRVQQLSETVRPPPVPTAVPTPTRTNVPLETSPPPLTPTTESPTVPGFGVGAALAGLAAGWLLRR